MMVSKFSLCFLVAFALCSFVSADDEVEKTLNEIVPWNHPVFQKAFKLVNLRHFKIVKEGKVTRIPHLNGDVTFLVHDLHIQKSPLNKRVHTCNLHLLLDKKHHKLLKKEVNCVLIKN